MTRGVRPVTAIGEAKCRAKAWGFRLIEIIMEEKIPFDFAVHHHGSTSLVRVRRLKYSAYDVVSIRTTCAEQIRELRELALPEGIGRELWVRGPQRAWHRYRILPETIEEITDISDTRTSTDGMGTGGEEKLPGQIQPG
jgi:hypothetical protein